VRSAPAGAKVDNRRGALLLAAAALVFTGEVTMVRLLGDAASNGQIVFSRAAVQLIVVATWIVLRDPGLARTARPRLHLLRGLTSLVCWWLYYRSFQVLDLGLATTLTFTTSLFVVAFAPLVLRERVGRARWLATAFGFGGVALASGVGSVALEAGIVYGLGAAAAAAVLVFLNRMLARTEATATIMLWIGVVATLGTLPGVLLDWRPLDAEALGLVLLAGALGTGGMVLTIEAYRVGEVSALAPFPYLRIVFALAAGYALFAERIAASTLAGAGVIIVCAFVASRGERRSRPREMVRHCRS